MFDKRHGLEYKAMGIESVRMKIAGNGKSVWLAAVQS
jgi:hypothetical protein